MSLIDRKATRVCVALGLGALALLAAAPVVGQTFDFSNNTVTPLPDAVTTTLDLTGSGGGTITDLNLQIDLDHTFDGDLDIFLEHDGISVLVSDQNGGGANDYTNTIFDDEGVTPITAGAAPFAGTFIPQNALAAFDGESIDGTWTLRIVDNFGADVGTLFLFRIFGTLMAVLVPAGGEAPVEEAAPDFTLGAMHPFDQETGETLNEIYAAGGLPPDLALVLRELDGVPEGGRKAALRGLGHDESPQQLDASTRMMGMHLSDVRDRQRGLRNAGFSAGATSFVLGTDGQWVPATPGLVASAVSYLGVAEALPANPPVSLGGAGVLLAQADGEVLAPRPPGRDAQVAGATVGVWAQARGSKGDKDATRNEAGYEIEGRGGSAGIDFRLSEQIVLGAAGGFYGSGADFNGDNGRANGDSYYASLYASYRPLEDLFLDVTGSYGWDEFETRRVAGIGSLRRVAEGDSDGRTFAIDAQGFYRMQAGGLTFGPLAGFRYVDAELEGYRETGAGSVSLDISSQDVDSFQTRLGTEAYFELKTPIGVLTPYVRGEWIHEFDDDVRNVKARFTGAPDFPFLLRTDGPDRDFFEVGAGVGATLGENFSAHVRYDALVGLDDWKLHQIVGGVSWAF